MIAGQKRYTGRLAIVTHNVIKGDGQGRANLEIAHHSVNEGFHVTLIADRVDEALAALESVQWIPVQPKMRGSALSHGLEFVQKADRLLHRMKNEFDIIHGYGYTLSVPHHVNTSQFVHSAWRQSPMHVAKINKNPYGLYQWLYSTVNTWGELRAYSQAQAVVAASSTVEKELESIGVAPARLRVILNGANLQEFYPNKANARSFREQNNLPTEAPLALFAGDIRTNRKNLDTVLRAFAQIKAQSPTHLVVLGRVEGSPFPKMARDLTIDDRVHFLDFRRDVPDIMRAVDFFVFPSRYEACALVLVEAIASGLPVITAKTTGGAEVLTPDCGILLDDPNNVDALAQAIARLGEDTGLRESMSVVARQEAHKYSWDKIAASYLDVYRTFLS